MLNDYNYFLIYRRLVIPSVAKYRPLYAIILDSRDQWVHNDKEGGVAY